MIYKYNPRIVTHPISYRKEARMKKDKNGKYVKWEDVKEILEALIDMVEQWGIYTEKIKEIKK